VRLDVKLLHMYLGVDIGGTKTLVASLDDDGVITEKFKFPTDPDYNQFLADIKDVLQNLKTKDFAAGTVAVTGPQTDRKHGVMITSSNLPWRNVTVQHDIERITHCPMLIENDAKLAALSEAMLLKDKYKVVLYVTVSTGIGFGLVVDGVIDDNVGDGGGKTILLEHNGKIMPWEDFASGKAIVRRYGKKAKDITDEKTWESISRDLAKGFIHLIAIVEPEVIVVGGGVGNYFNRFGHFLKKDIDKYKIPLINMPVLMEAQRPDEAVVYGCYDLAKQHYSHATLNR
jgi:predicted NBD/HSP70 family sugar kinase